MSQAGNTPPPVLNLPWGTMREGGKVYLDISSLQFLQTIWTAVKQPAVAFSQLPATPDDGQRAFMTDSTVVAAGNFGVAATGGGANHVPVYWDAVSGAWFIG